MKVKNINDLRRLYFKTVQTTAVNHGLPYKPRWINMLYANFLGYFWLACHKCNTNYGGHEWYGSDGSQGICPECALKKYNETNSFS
jgi:hypothetical protein